MNGPVTASPPRRPVRDRVVDVAIFVLVIAFGLLTAIERGKEPLPEPSWLLQLDQAIGVLSCAALLLRRRRPVELAVVLVVVSAWSEFVAGALLVALFTVAVHRPPRVSGAVFALSVVSALAYVLLRPEPAVPPLMMFLFGLAIQGAAVGWGLFVHHRRHLVLSLRDRAARAETEAHLRALQAQHQAREAIAREIHDVLGHRLSLLSVHAGALEYHPGASPEDISRAAKVIRESAHQALQDLREVIGVLRAPVGELPGSGLADLRTLVAESRLAGMRVELAEELAGPAPGEAGHTAYRIVQEGLTNARKHAPRSAVRVRLSGAPGRGLEVEIRNPLPARAAAAPPARAGDARAVTGGQGLAGLAERVSLAGGGLEHGPTGEGDWRLAARLPWPP
ncbi:two-component sensor histidine kinase [Sphaerisporangium melleum]|uniref:histidine kinase n=1 Tax=Sphaerisporangium melleum TaxID=321316 RepID=A0A917VIA9_9ACTN|nr:histidine kinase [Sphaerisporangium melleum]GGK86077.1 two-component sensor histidine kinase [Sphaerisporangium melleum]GII71461.1 two-component sensor histidine kinase [Sphaerisporangium melleum]